MVESRALITTDDTSVPANMKAPATPVKTDTPSATIKPYLPTVGTVVTISSYNEDLTFIVRMPKEKVIEFLLTRVEMNRAWISQLVQCFLGVTPTMPFPEGCTLPVVKIDPSAREVKWTSDGWDTYEGRRQKAGKPTSRDGWIDFCGTTKPNTQFLKPVKPVTDICDGGDPYVSDADKVVIMGTA